MRTCWLLIGTVLQSLGLPCRHAIQKYRCPTCGRLFTSLDVFELPRNGAHDFLCEACHERHGMESPLEVSSRFMQTQQGVTRQHAINDVSTGSMQTVQAPLTSVHAATASNDHQLVKTTQIV